MAVRSLNNGASGQDSYQQELPSTKPTLFLRTIWPSEHPLWRWQQIMVRVMCKVRTQAENLQLSETTEFIHGECGDTYLGSWGTKIHLSPFLLASDPRILLEQRPSRLLPQLGGQAKGPIRQQLPVCRPPAAPASPSHFI